MPMVLILFTWLTLGPFEGWQTLEKLKLQKTYDEFLGEETDMPIFSDDIRAFDGKVVTIEGYVIPLQESFSQGYFVLSRFPYNNCFFCGNAGPETVAEVYTSGEFEVMDARVEVTGRLELNADDPTHLFFIFNEASVRQLD